MDAQSETPNPAEEPTLTPQTAIEQIEARAEEAIAAIKATPSEMEAKVHAEVDTFWANVVANVSARVETPIHNFIHAEKEALKARLSALF